SVEPPGIPGTCGWARTSCGFRGLLRWLGAADVVARAGGVGRLLGRHQLFAVRMERVRAVADLWYQRELLAAGLDDRRRRAEAGGHQGLDQLAGRAHPPPG